MADTQATVALAIREAIQYVDEELSPERSKATEYYHAQPFGNEEKGRSQAVLSVVRDGIVGVLPSILRVIHGPEHVVAFVPRNVNGVGQAEQATDAIRFVYEEDNPGFLITHSVLKDGLLKKLGVVKWGMDTTPKMQATAYSGVSRDEVMLLGMAPGVRITRLTPEGGDLFHVETLTTEPGGRIWVAACPPDDVFWNREARGMQDVRLFGHRMRPTRGELLAMGVTQDQIEEFAGSAPSLSMEEVSRRAIAGNASAGMDPELGEANQRALYCEVYCYLAPEDENGEPSDEPPTLRRLCTLGDGYQIIKNEPADEIPFAVFSPDPEPHAMLGGSYYDRLKDQQMIQSQILRLIFDSAAIAAFPRVGYVDGQVSVADIMNTAIGAPIRMRQPGMVTPFEQPFTGEKLLPLLGVMQEVVERRIGNKDGAGSLDMDALQSTGKEAVNAALLAATSQPELLTRLFAEQVLKPMFRGILKLLAHPASKERLIRLRGQYVQVAPSTWDANMDVAVNVALGTMDADRKAGVLQAVINDQSAILQQFGPANPVVTVPMLRNAKARLLRLHGIQDVDSYYKPLPDDWVPPPPPPPQPTPDQLWAETEKQLAHEKAIKELTIKQDELELERQKQADDVTLKARDLAIKEAALTSGQHGSEVETYKADVQAQTDREKIAADTAIAQQKLDLEREKLAIERMKLELERDRMAHEATMRAADREAAVNTPQPAAPAAPPMPNIEIEIPGLDQVAEALKARGGKKSATITDPAGKTYTLESGESDGD